MHPNAFLRTFWQADIRPEIFVAMSFSPEYEDRFKYVIEPAIKAITHRGRQLRANRVDLSKSGDSILTDIVDGIAHCEMILADVSTVGNDSKSGKRYRNGNVMYEVGIALACRHSSEVLLIRDDQDPFLFDVSTIPHKRLDFTDHTKAKEELAEELVSRLREQNHLNDARLKRAVASLTSQERNILRAFADYPIGNSFWITKQNFGSIAAIPRLLDKQLLLTVGVHTDEDASAVFTWTRLGYTIAKNLDSLLVLIGKDEKTPASDTPLAPPAPDPPAVGAGS